MEHVVRDIAALPPASAKCSCLQCLLSRILILAFLPISDNSWRGPCYLPVAIYLLLYLLLLCASERHLIVFHIQFMSVISPFPVFIVGLFSSFTYAFRRSSIFQFWCWIYVFRFSLIISHLKYKTP